MSISGNTGTIMGGSLCNFSSVEGTTQMVSPLFFNSGAQNTNVAASTRKDYVDDLILGINNLLAALQASKQDTINSATGLLGDTLIVGSIMTSVTSGDIVAANSIRVGTTDLIVEIGTKQDIIDGTTDLTCDVLTANEDLDGINIIGRTKIGASGLTDRMVLSHYNNATSTNYAINQNSNGITYVNCADTGFQRIVFASGGVEKMRMSHLGHLGIGNTNPQAKLHISGTGGTISQIAYNGSIGGGYQLNWNGVYHNVWTTLSASVGIVCDGTIIAHTVHVGYGISFSSDERIKYDIQDINDDYALQKIILVKPKTYYYKDKTKGTHKVVGFIAQDIRDDLPEAHSYTINYVPNFYQDGFFVK
jgi:hypothetical protein